MVWGINKQKRFFVLLNWGSLVLFVVILYSSYETILRKSRSVTMGTRVKTVNFNNEFISTSSAWKDTWKQVTNNIYVYSAFWDDRNNSLKNFIRIIAVGPRLEDEQRNVICSIYDQSSETLIDLAITYEIIRDNHSKNYSAMYFFCPFSSGEPTPREVVLRQASTPLELVKLPIHRRESQNSTKSQDKLAVCVRPLFGPFKNSFALAEFVAFYQILGVSHFTFYNYKTTKQVKDFLFSLQNQGLPVELLHWNLPRTVAQKTWAYGQMASTEDCIYRHMFLSKYVALVDIDEYIVPRNHQTILEMIKSFKNTTWGSLVFHNSFFCTKHPVKVKYSKQNLPFTTLRYLTRVKHVSRAYFRSKPMVQPTRVVTGGIHFVWQHFANWQPFVVPPSECLLHHYRSGICSEASYKSGVEDKTILKFKDKLLKANAIKMWMTINKRNMFP